MSTDYGVVCKDCVEIMWWDNLHKESAEHLLADATHLADIAELISKLRSEEVRVDLEYQEGVDLGFFAGHRGHNLVVLNEYEWFELRYSKHVPDEEPDHFLTRSRLRKGLLFSDVFGRP